MPQLFYMLKKQMLPHLNKYCSEWIYQLNFCFVELQHRAFATKAINTAGHMYST